MADYTLVYPPAHNATYVKATTTYSASYYPYFGTDPAKSLIGTSLGTSWLASAGSNTNQRFHIDLGSAKIIRRIYYENYHHLTIGIDQGAKTLIFQGSNTAASFAELTYATDTGWTTLTCSQNTFDEHVGADTEDPKYILVTNVTAYRYYAFKFADAWGASVMGVRRVSLMTQDRYNTSKFFIFLFEAWQKHDKLWTPKLILPKEGYSY